MKEVNGATTIQAIIGNPTTIGQIDDDKDKQLKEKDDQLNQLKELVESLKKKVPKEIVKLDASKVSEKSIEPVKSKVKGAKKKNDLIETEEDPLNAKATRSRKNFGPDLKGIFLATKHNELQFFN